MPQPQGQAPDRSGRAGEVDQNQLAKMALEVGPIAIFFLVNSQRGIFWGTGAFMAATLVSLVVSRRVLGRIPLMPLISGVFVLVFGGLTLLLQDAVFIKMKPTIVNGIFAAILFGGLAFRMPLLRYLMGDVFQLADEGWTRLTLRWACFFVVLAILNEIVWRNFSEAFWISFKLWGIMPLTIAFAVAQVGLLKRYGTPDQKPAA
jgi:intracellular septation protein